VSIEALVDELQELSQYLMVDGKPGYGATVSNAALAVKKKGYVPANPAEIEGVGETVREFIVEYQHAGEIQELESLRDQYPYFERFRNIDGVGPATARKLGDAGIRTKPELEYAIETGEILDVDGIGQKTAENILQNL